MAGHFFGRQMLSRRNLWNSSVRPPGAPCEYLLRTEPFFAASSSQRLSPTAIIDSQFPKQRQQAWMHNQPIRNAAIEVHAVHGRIAFYKLKHVRSADNVKRHFTIAASLQSFALAHSSGFVSRRILEIACRSVEERCKYASPPLPARTSLSRFAT